MRLGRVEDKGGGDIARELGDVTVGNTGVVKGEVVGGEELGSSSFNGAGTGDVEVAVSSAR